MTNGSRGVRSTGQSPGRADLDLEGASSHPTTGATAAVAARHAFDEDHLSVPALHRPRPILGANEILAVHAIEEPLVFVPAILRGVLVHGGAPGDAVFQVETGAEERRPVLATLTASGLPPPAPVPPAPVPAVLPPAEVEPPSSPPQAIARASTIEQQNNQRERSMPLAIATSMPPANHMVFGSWTRRPLPGSRGVT